MRLTVQHRTTFTYDAPVTETATEARLQPANVPGAPQRCLDFALTVEPATMIAHYVDYFGNEVQHFTFVPPHQRVTITATSLVATGLGQVPAGPDETILRQDFLRESHYVRFAPSVRDFGATFAPDLPPAALAEAIARRINETFIYEAGVTDVYSTTEEVMALGRGVCQDFAHAMTAVCRTLGLPARYISGYIYGGPETEEEDRASHAWCEVFCGEEHGWLGFDPTHETILVDERYVRVGSGRDYADVAPVRGTFKGTAKEHLQVVVRIASADREAALHG
jgi:transglutaminase-like putative cysteine protease